MRASLRHVVFALSAILTGIFLPHLQAQSTSGTITGSVTDATGAVVPGATVTILNPVSGYTRTAKTDGSGSYQFQNIPFNPYHLTVVAAGFASRAQDVEVKSPVVVKVTTTLNVEAASTTVKVESTAGDLLETDSDDAYRYRPQPVSGIAVGKRDFLGEFAGHAIVARNFGRFEWAFSRPGRPCVEFVFSGWAADYRPAKQGILEPDSIEFDPVAGGDLGRAAGGIWRQDGASDPGDDQVGARRDQAHGEFYDFLRSVWDCGDFYYFDVGGVGGGSGDS